MNITKEQFHRDMEKLFQYKPRMRIAWVTVDTWMAIMGIEDRNEAIRDLEENHKKLIYADWYQVGYMV